MKQRGFLSPNELALGDQFLEDGYVVTDVENHKLLAKIRSVLVKFASEYLSVQVEEPEQFLNGVHQIVAPDQLNDFRLHIIEKFNALPWFRESYFNLVRKSLEMLVGNELAMQLRVNLNIQLPGDSSSLLPVHADTWSGNSPFELVVWLPLVNCYGTKAMFLLPPEPTKNVHANFESFQQKSSEALYKMFEDDMKWIQISYGKVLFFNQNLPHGNRVNHEPETRWSMNCRFKSVFSPYGDKKLGEYFEPITLRVASRIGMSYRHPGDTC